MSRLTTIARYSVDAVLYRKNERLLNTYFVYWLELLGPILISSPLFLRPIRTVLMVMFVAMHVGVLLCLEIGMFPLLGIFMNLLFIHIWMWDGSAEWFYGRGSQSTRKSVSIWSDGDCEFCLKTARLFRRIPPVGNVLFRLAIPAF